MKKISRTESEGNALLNKVVGEELCEEVEFKQKPE
jgi:hypothetical protein